MAFFSDGHRLNSAGLTGLANVGNTCYLNSCLQVLSHTPEFTNLLQANNGAYKQRLNRVPDSILLLEWDKLRQELWRQSSSTASSAVVVPQNFVRTVQRVAVLKKRDLFAGHAQNDVQEFLLFLIDCFHTALQREVDMHIAGTEVNATDRLATTCYTMMQNMYRKEYSELLNIFYGIHVSEITALHASGPGPGPGPGPDKVPLALSPEPFSVLSLSIPSDQKQPTLFQCLDLYCQKEVLSGPNAWFNSQTQAKQSVQRGILFWSLPQILIIDLKRWNGQLRKNQVLVDMPLVDLDLSAYVRGYNAASFVYDLYGVCNHSGGVLGGHYTAYIKAASATGSAWYAFNDTLVSPLAADKVITPYAYCFFYRKK
jgi:ubiquitin carboxyl-terminal hydrolase 8